MYAVLHWSKLFDWFSCEKTFINFLSRCLPCRTSRTLPINYDTWSPISVHTFNNATATGNRLRVIAGCILRVYHVLSKCKYRRYIHTRYIIYRNHWHLHYCYWQYLQHRNVQYSLLAPNFLSELLWNHIICQGNRKLSCFSCTYKMGHLANKYGCYWEVGIGRNMLVNRILRRHLRTNLQKVICMRR